MPKNISAPLGTLVLLAMFVHLPSPGNHGVSANEGGAKKETRSSTEGAGRRSSARPASSKAHYPKGPWLATRSFFQREPKSGILNHDGKPVSVFNEEALDKCITEPGCRASIQTFFGADGGDPIDFTIVTISDPLHTRLPLQTDAMINAIEEAAGQAGWEFANQWLPWSAGNQSDESDQEPEQEPSVVAHTTENQPGVLIFRHQVEELPRTKQSPFDRARSLVIFLVGETPTGGINPVQFKLAREYIRALQGPQKVRILGPAFSGSFYSLYKLISWDIQTHGIQPSDFVVRTGTATGNANADTLGRLVKDFHGANESLADQQLHFCEVLGRLRIPSSAAAYLVEGETGYGNLFSNKAVTPHACQGVKFYRFPREISHLRNAYRDAVAASRGADAQTSDLDFSLKDSSHGEDSVPVFSETQTPLSQNAVLGEIAGQIRRNDIRIVEVGATNVLDLLFVTRVLRQQCPDTRVLVAFPDLMFVQALQSEPLTGLLSLSTYPLFPQRDKWMNNAPSGVTYTDMNSEGVYNAMLMLLEQSSNPEDSQHATGAISDFGWRSLPHAPTWLMTLDGGGFSPVNVFTKTGTAPNEHWFESVSRKTKAGTLELPRPSTIWKMFAGILYIFSFCFSGFVVWLKLKPTARMFGYLSPDRASRLDTTRVFFLFVSFTILSILTLVFCLPLVLQPFESLAWDFWILIALGSASPMIVGILIAIRLLRQPVVKRIRRGMIVCVLFYGFCVAAWVLCCSAGTDQAFFFCFRSLELRIGSSPVVPIAAVLIAFFIFSLVHTKRFFLISNQRPRLFTTTLDDVLESQMKRARAEMTRALLAPFSLGKKSYRLAIFLVAAVSIAMVFLLRVPVHLSSFEGGLYDVLSMTLQVLLVLALVLTCWHLKVIWSWFHSFLGSLDTLPLSEAFGELSDKGKNGPIWARRLNLLSLEIAIRAGKTLHDMRIMIQSEGDKFPNLKAGAVNEWFEHYRLAVKKLLDNDGPCLVARKHSSRLTVLRDSIRQKQVRAAITDEICRKVLIPHWRDHCFISDHCEKSEKASSPDDQEESSAAKPKAPVSAAHPNTFFELSQSFVALHYSAFLVYGLRQIQNLLGFLSLGFVLLTISLNSYAYQSPRLIGRFLIVLFLVLSYFGWRCMSEMERDPIMSRIAGTTEGKLNKGFYLKLVSYGGLPIIGILASQFPAISHFLFSSVQPALEALR